MGALPDLKGRVFLVTGANAGIGRATALALAGAGGRVHVACRSLEKCAPVVDEIRAAGGSAEPLAIDLADLASVRDAARAFLDRGEPLHVLINNAGLAGVRGLTASGFELAFGTNHVGPFLLTRLLIDRLRASSPARVVSVSSKAHYDARGIDFEAVRRPTATFSGLPEYAVSKLANVLFMRELAKRVDGGVTTYSLHPGVVASDIWRRVPWPARPIMRRFMLTVEQGAQTSLYCATSPEVAEQSGRYYDNSRERRPSDLALDDGLAKTLWEKSEEWTAEYRA